MDMLKVRRVLEGLTGQDAPHRPELPRHHHARAQCKIGIMPGPHPQGGPHRRRLALGHAHLRGRRAAHGARHRPVHVHRHRRRSRRRHGLRRRARALPGRPRHARRHPDRRDRRRRRGARRATFIKEKMNKPVAGFIAGHDRARRASAWATPAPSSPAARARPPRRSRRSRPPARGSRPTPSDMATTLVGMMAQGGASDSCAARVSRKSSRAYLVIRRSPPWPSNAPSAS